MKKQLTSFGYFTKILNSRLALTNTLDKNELRVLSIPMITIIQNNHGSDTSDVIEPITIALPVLSDILQVEVTQEEVLIHYICHSHASIYEEREMIFLPKAKFVKSFFERWQFPSGLYHHYCPGAEYFILSSNTYSTRTLAILSATEKLLTRPEFRDEKGLLKSDIKTNLYIGNIYENPNWGFNSLDFSEKCVFMQVMFYQDYCPVVVQEKAWHFKDIPGVTTYKEAGDIIENYQEWMSVQGRDIRIEQKYLLSLPLGRELEVLVNNIKNDMNKKVPDLTGFRGTVGEA